MHYKHLSSDGWEPEGAGVCVLTVSLLYVYYLFVIHLLYAYVTYVHMKYSASI